MRPTAIIAITLTALGFSSAVASGQSVASRVNAVREGDVRMSFDLRPGVCGRGSNVWYSGRSSVNYDNDRRNRDVEYTAFRNEGMKVRIYGQTAIVTGRTIVQGTTRAGDKIDIEVQFTDTLVLMDGRWRMVAGHVARLKS